jgi:hypothetical protein
MKTHLRGIDRELALEFVRQLDSMLGSFQLVRFALRDIYLAPNPLAAAFDTMPGDTAEAQFSTALQVCIDPAVILAEKKRAGEQPTGRIVIDTIQTADGYMSTVAVVWNPYSTDRKCVLFREVKASDLVGHDSIAGLVRKFIRPLYDEIVRSLDRVTGVIG